MLIEYFKAQRLLDQYGIKSIKSTYVNSAEEAITFSEKEPIILKAISDKAIHKSKAGLVKLNLNGQEEIAAAYKSLQRAASKFAPYKILAQKMSANGIEIILGGSVDAQFGKTVLIGLGGIYVETFKDVAMRLCPITRYDAKEMLYQLKSASVITYDGAATNMLVDLLIKFSKMFYERAELKEVDLNPIIVRRNSYDAVDLRLMI
ncbi:MAG: acetate--CoA ligase family protein [Candidatus Micrarchaeaceae archaeon]